MADTSLIFSSDILLAHDISEITLLDLPLNIAFTHLATQKNGNKYGAFFKQGNAITIDLYGRNSLFTA